MFRILEPTTFRQHAVPFKHNYINSITLPNYGIVRSITLNPGSYDFATVELNSNMQHGYYCTSGNGLRLVNKVLDTEYTIPVATNLPRLGLIGCVPMQSPDIMMSLSFNTTATSPDHMGLNLSIYENLTTEDEPDFGFLHTWQEHHFYTLYPWPRITWNALANSGNVLRVILSGVEKPVLTTGNEVPFRDCQPQEIETGVWLYDFTHLAQEPGLNTFCIPNIRFTTSALPDVTPTLLCEKLFPIVTY